MDLNIFNVICSIVFTTCIEIQTIPSLALGASAVGSRPLGTTLTLRDYGGFPALSGVDVPCTFLAPDLESTISPGNQIPFSGKWFLSV